MPNPDNEFQALLEDALQLLRPRFIDGISEYDLLRILQTPPYSLFEEEALRDSLTLFQTHFVLFHSLYKLRARWREHNQEELDIGPVNILIKPLPPTSAALQAADPLAEYYLDWTNLFDTTLEDVHTLLDSFWQKMAGAKLAISLSESDLNEACDTLHIQSLENLTESQLKQSYRKLQHQHHPDKGGNLEQSQNILKAYQILRQYIVHMGK